MDTGVGFREAFHREEYARSLAYERWMLTLTETALTCRICGDAETWAAWSSLDDAPPLR